MRIKAIVNLDNLKYNLHYISKKTSVDKIMAIIKANAYGHGDEEILKFCINYGINKFGVATVEEAIKIRKIDKNIEILILGPIEKSDFKLMENENISFPITSFDEIKYIKENKINANIHFAFDTGMGRIGFNENDIEKALKMLKPIGIFTHLSSADIDSIYTKNQIKLFDDILDKYDVKYKHILNSYGFLNYYSNKYSFSRLGIILYGAEENSIFKPVMTLKARVNYIKKLEKDTFIGYSKSYYAKKGDIIATISMGYADGLSRLFSNKMEVAFNNKKYKQIGNICMDQFMILADSELKVGDYVEIFGENILVSTLAKSINTISYELLSSLGVRVKRIYEEGENNDY